ncbi:hypothetical protein, partial [Eggerthella lenta]|uniref:hypothetical protein n=1 Tax=Eggerthella lenta TaxID=84112 RepID=UPI0022E69C7A
LAADDVGALQHVLARLPTCWEGSQLRVVLPVGRLDPDVYADVLAVLVRSNAVNRIDLGYGMLCHGECDRSVDEGVAYLSAERVDRYGPICLDLDHDVSGAG